MEGNLWLRLQGIPGEQRGNRGAAAEMRIAGTNLESLVNGAGVRYRTSVASVEPEDEYESDAGLIFHSKMECRGMTSAGNSGPSREAGGSGLDSYFFANLETVTEDYQPPSPLLLYLLLYPCAKKPNLTCPCAL